MMKLNKHMKQVGDIKDRGSIKWQGMFLPEHVEMLRDWKEESKRIPKPELDEWDLRFIQEEVEIAMKSKSEVLIQSWKEHKFHYHRGTIEDMDPQRREILYDDPFGLHRLPIDEIVAISIVG